MEKALNRLKGRHGRKHPSGSGTTSPIHPHQQSKPELHLEPETEMEQGAKSNVADESGELPSPGDLEMADVYHTSEANDSIKSFENPLHLMGVSVIVDTDGVHDVEESMR